MLVFYIVVAWNFAHLNNPFIRKILRWIIEEESYECPEICSPDELLEVIEKVYKELSDPRHPISIAMARQKTIPEVRIIEGLDK
ncbi:MAG: hypothetical protein Q8O28_11570 [Smithellaceae bacterium]|nr:hypothetical protein [Smithellaceae bacterium]